MGAGPLIRMIRRKYFLASVFLFGILYTIIKPFGGSSYSETLVYQILNFQNNLSYLITPNQVFDKYTIFRKNALSIICNSIYNKLSNPDLENASWRFTRGLVNSQIDSIAESKYIESYTTTRQSLHFYDPRITYSVYLNALNLQFSEQSNTIPFSWEDWTDLSYLNKFLSESKKISCADFMTNFEIKTTYEIDPSLKSSEITDKTYCLDNNEYLETENGQYRSDKLLPGFNFRQHIEEKSNFIGQVYNAKSYLLSYAPPPTFIYFLSDNGTYYKAQTVQSTNMMENGLFDKFRNSKSFHGFDPVQEQMNIDPKFLLHNENDFGISLLKSKNFQYDVPDTKFDLDYSVTFSDIFSKDQSELSNHQLLFKRSIEYSESISEELLEKYFKEINIHFPARYSGHKLTESGAHYDSRFFSGLLTEMPNSEFTPHSPYFRNLETDDRKEVPSSDHPVKRRSIILSNMIHTILTTTFHEGLIMVPAHGSLLSWYFASSTFPWDTDADVQMPIEDLATFCLNFNNSMIVQNPKYGTSKLFVDCTNTLTHRVKGNGNNNIDARIVDIDSGVFIDVTGLSVSHDRISKGYLNNIKSWLPNVDVEKYPYLKRKTTKNISQKIRGENKNVYTPKTPAETAKDNIAYEIHKKNRLYNCRNDHFYTYEQLSPLRLTLFEGAPTFVAAESKAIRFPLEIEYKKMSYTKPFHDTFFFVKELSMWIHADDVYYALLNNDIQVNSKARKSSSRNRKNVRGAMVFDGYRRNNAIAISELVKFSLYDLTQEESFSSPDNRTPVLNIFEEAFHDREFTSAHEKEMRIFNYAWEWKTSKIDDQVDVPSDWKKLAQWMLLDHPPRKMSYFDYLIFSEKQDRNEEIIIKKKQNYENDNVSSSDR